MNEEFEKKEVKIAEAADNGPVIAEMDDLDDTKINIKEVLPC